MSVTEIIHPKAKAKLRHMRTLIDGSWVDKPVRSNADRGRPSGT